MHLSRALSALLAASVLTACATSAAAPSRKPASTPSRTPVPESTVAPPLTDAQVARRGVLRRSDFPAEWKASTRKGKRLRCAATTAARKAAAAMERSPTFTTGPNTEVEAVAYVFHMPARARKHYGVLSKPGFASCLMSGFTGLLAKAGYTIGSTATAPLTLDAVGDERSGTQLTIPVSRQGVDANILIDVVVARSGRALALELFVDAFDPFDSGFRGKLTAAQMRRLRDAQLR
jgi:hypothetical protein